jgi:hypothetical protein
MNKEEATSDIIVSLILTLITCGIYDLFWNAKQMRVLNHLLGREEFFFWTWLIVSIITCGIFHIFYEYKMGQAIVEIKKKRNLPVDEHLPLISIALSVFSLSLAVDAIHQYEINKIYESNNTF